MTLSVHVAETGAVFRSAGICPRSSGCRPAAVMVPPRLYANIAPSPTIFSSDNVCNPSGI